MNSPQTHQVMRPLHSYVSGYETHTPQTFHLQCSPLSTHQRESNFNVFEREREFFIDNLMAQIHFVVEMIRWTGLAQCEAKFPVPGSLTSTFLAPLQVLSIFSAAARPPTSARSGCKSPLYISLICTACRHIPTTFGRHQGTSKDGSHPLRVFTLRAPTVNTRCAVHWHPLSHNSCSISHGIIQRYMAGPRLETFSVGREKEAAKGG